MELYCRRCTALEFEACWQVLQNVANWLTEIGRKQRISATSFETYRHWHDDGCNFGVFSRNAKGPDTIAGIFTLVAEPMDDWPGILVNQQNDRAFKLDSNSSRTQKVKWLRALATDPNFRGHDIGRFAIGWILDSLENGQAVYLDCVSDFLPEYYESNGFTLLERKLKTNNDGTQIDITLLRYIKWWIHSTKMQLCHHW